MRVPAFALVLGGCSFSASAPGSATIDSAPPIIDSAPLDGKVPAVCEGAYVNVCVDPPQSDVTLTQNINTTNSPLCAAYTATPSTTGACVITGQSITIPSGATVSVTGNRQLILFSTGSIRISGTLDAAGHGRTSGPFGDAGPCGAGAKNPTSGKQGGGGWGGSFGGPGSNGGNGASGSGGVAPPAITATTLRGGCRGSDGANNEFRNGGGSHGGGGGAVLLIARTTITIDGTVNASGGSGGHGAFGGGGGGGGSGGMIALDAVDSVTLQGKCFANGGGAGEGGSFNNGRDGGESKAPDSAGTGGQGGSVTGGDGGNGGFGTTGSLPGSNGTKGNPQTGDGGGGGGGGGVGIIKVFATAQSGTDDPTKIAPLPSN